MISYSIGTQWNLTKTLEILALNDGKNQINDVYGSLAFSPMGHGRSPYAVPHISNDTAKELIRAVKQAGAKFNYLLNGNFEAKRLQDPNFVSDVLRYVEFIIKEFKADFVTVAVPELIDLINQYFPEVQIKVSTIRNVLSKDDLVKLDGLKFQRVTLGNDAPRSFAKLEELIKYSQEKGIEIEMMITETCLFRCPTRQMHYRKLTTKEVGASDWFINNCISKRILHPEEVFKANWVRPEDLDFYVQMGIKNFKISGRSKTAEWTKRCLQAYFARAHTGNLMEVLGTTPPDFENNAEHLFYIENSSLQDFLKNYPRNCQEMACEECKYCLNTAIELFQAGSFRINPICGTYTVEKGKFVCTPGPYTKMLVASLEEVQELG